MFRECSRHMNTYTERNDKTNNSDFRKCGVCHSYEWFRWLPVVTPNYSFYIEFLFINKISPQVAIKNS